MVFLTYRPMPPAPWAIPTAGEAANLDYGPSRDELTALMWSIFGPPTPREQAGMDRIMRGEAL